MDPHTAMERESADAVLLIGLNESRCSALQHILSGESWEIHPVRTCSEALDLLNSLQATVAICEGGADDGYWQSILAKLQARAAAPNLIVSCRLADERLWAEVLNLGGYDVLVQPFDPTEVARVVYMASMDWHNRNNSMLQGRKFRAAAS